MAEEKRAFDASEASLLVRELRTIFNSGRTKSYDWRISQLRGIEMMMEEREKDVVEALHMDLSKPELETIIAEVRLTSLLLPVGLISQCGSLLAFQLVQKPLFHFPPKKYKKKFK